MPKAIDKKIRNKAKKLHCVEGKTLEEVSKELNLDIEAVKTWHKVDKWKKAKEDISRNLAEEIKNEGVKRQFDVIQEYYDTILQINNLTSDAEKLETNALLTTKQKYMKDLAQIEGKLTEKIKHEGEVKVIPILGGIAQ